MMTTPFKGIAFAALVLLLTACGSKSDSSSQNNTAPKNTGNVAVNDSVISLQRFESTSCANGTEVQMGIDANANGRLDPDEVDHARTVVVCNGVDGVSGKDGSNSLINVTDADKLLCEFGGKTVSIGSDTNNNNTLEISEINQTESICNQNAPTYTSLINTSDEPVGIHCPAAGVKVETGLDLNKDGQLASSEVQNTDYICHGENGVGTGDSDLSNLLIETVPEPWGENCFHGGEKHQIGLDENQNNLLDELEIISASYSCNFNSAPEIEFHTDYQFQSISTPKAIAGQSYSIRVRANDYDDADGATLSVTNKPDWMTTTQIQADMLELSGVVPDGIDVKYMIEVSATDGNATTLQFYEFTAIEGLLISASADAIVEGNEGTKTTSFTVELSKALEQTVKLSYHFEGSNSVFGQDWRADNQQGTLVFSPGETSKQINIEVIADTKLEVYEFITLNLSVLDNSNSGLAILSGPAYLEIVNDDGNEVVFGSGQENKIEVMSATSWNDNSISFNGDAPSWMGINQICFSEIIDNNYLNKCSYVLTGLLTSSLIGETGTFAVIINTQSGQKEVELTYRITEGDSDNDGVVNSEDAFPNNAAAHTDTDLDGIGDEWEIAHFENLTTATSSSDFDNNGVTDLSAFVNNTPVHDLTFSFESGELPSGWVNTGNVNWVVTNESSYEGQYALKTEQQLEPGQVARLEFDIRTQAGNLRMYTRAVSDANSYVNGLSIQVGDYTDALSVFGTNWNSTYDQIKAGNHHVVFEFRNDTDYETKPLVYVDFFNGLKGIVPADRDGDGVANADDLFPDNAAGAADTDNDGIADEWEIQHVGSLSRMNANTDQDNDGLSDLNEFKLGSRPFDSDSDYDGVSDGEDLYVTDKRYARDTDNDGLPDEWELQYFLTLNETDGTQDSDGDTVLDAEEFAQSSVPAPDSDNDGVSDGLDLYPSNPLYALDTDKDGLPDEWELSYRSSLDYLHGNNDYDNDSRSDLLEFQQGTNPIVINVTAVQDVLAVSAGKSVTFNPLVNDILVSADIAVSTIDSPSAGVLVSNEDGTYTYTAPENFIGQTSIHYTIEDAQTISASVILIKITDQQFGQVVKMKSSLNGCSHSMALYDDQSLYAWGCNASGQLGLGDNVSQTSPQLIRDFDGVVDFALGSNFSVALKEDGTVWVWGNNNGATPKVIASLAGVQAIAAENSTLHALKSDGTVWSAYYYNLSYFSQVTGVNTITAISAGANHLLALDENGQMWAEGQNSYGMLGNGTESSSNGVFVPVSKISDVSSIHAGSNQSFAINNAGQVYAWGENGSYQLGDGTSTKRNVPVLIEGITNAVSIEAGNNHTLFLTTGQALYGAGQGWNGTFGGHFDSATTPKVIFNNGVSVVGAGSYSSFVVMNDGKSLSAGQNSYGQLGVGTKQNSNVFKEIDWLNVGADAFLSETWGEGFEFGFLPPYWSNPNHNWLISADAFTGNYSLKTVSNLGDYNSASVGLKITTGVGDISFSVKISTEADYDELIFYIDDVEQARYSGEMNWATTFNFPVTAGQHTLQWVYQKDGGTSVGQDSVWIDDIKLPLDTDGDGVLDLEDLNPNNPLIM